MNTYLIGYDLNSPGQDYQTLFDKIKECGTWWHHLDSTWIVKSNRSAVQLRDGLMPFVDKNDELLVVRLAGEGAWTGFNQAGSDWLKENL